MKKLGILRTALAGGVCALALATAAYAQEPRPFDLPAGELSVALDAYIRQSGTQLIYQPSDVRGRRSARVSGTLPPEEALDRLLAGSGLRVVRDSTGAVMIVRPQSGAAAPSGAGDATRIDDIVVTGTWIGGGKLVGSDRISVGRDEIEASGRSTVADFLRTMPQFSALGATDVAASSTQNSSSNVGFGVGANLRGLGPDSTLVLFNGRRLAATGSGSFVDMSLIPMGAVQRVDVVADGASATYGADAVGGVVNIITRRAADRPELGVRYEHGDGVDGYSINASGGLEWQGGSIVAAYEHFYRSALSASDRDYITSDLTGLGSINLNSTYSDPGNLVVGGVTYAIPRGQNGRSLTASQLAPGTANRLDYWHDADIMPEQSRDSVVVSGEQRLSERIRFVGDLFYSRRETVRKQFPQSLNLVVPSTNAFFVTPVPGATSVTVRYSPIDEMGSPEASGPVDVYAVSGGLEIEGPSGWTGSFTAASSGSRSYISIANNINSTLILPYLASSDPNVAFNPFGDGPGVNNPATLEAVRGWFKTKERDEVNSISANITGPLMELPGGAVRLAVGAEYRQEDYRTTITSFTSRTEPWIYQATSGTREISAGYGELFVPLIGSANSFTGARSLDLSAAVRYERYSDFGSTTNPKIGLRWSPIEGLELRGSYGTSFRAPVQESLYGTWYPSISNVSTSAGIRPFLVIWGANPDLGPQKADTISYGFDFQPPALSGLSIHATAFKVNYTDRISTLVSGNFATAVANPSVFGKLVNLSPSLDLVQSYLSNPSFSGSPVPAASVVGIIDARSNNTGSVVQEGVDARVNYFRDIGAGVLSVGFSGTWLNRYDITVVQGLNSADLLNVLGNPSRFRGRGTLGWEAEAFDANLAINYLDKYENRAVTPAVAVDAWTTVDVHLGVDLGSLHAAFADTSIDLDVVNLLNENPPITPVTSSVLSFDPNAASPIGRMVSLTLRKRW